MDAKRFGAGIFGGLAVGLFVIFALAAQFGSLGASMDNAGQLTNGASSATTTSQTLSSSQGVPVQAGQSNMTKSYSTSSMSRSTTSAPSQASGTVQPTPAAIAFVNNGAGNAPSQSPSKVSNFIQQSASTNLLVFIPVLVAFLLGAVIYRSSRTDEVNDSDEAGSPATAEP